MKKNLNTIKQTTHAQVNKITLKRPYKSAKIPASKPKIAEPVKINA